eukprot:CAMPEP_0182493410 /NCGR_PEP_ID=MMETSP1321-20130603/2362_1 /TAXON_ID=91990 /ORGANISM="Bolidomonas sp., Strain RCC1657" /LENGTH=324 /DNA_ID=CAMNT_0024696157 /DNA_START=20 /DNA_END=994 /DNA_ORIENTATION=+
MSPSLQSPITRQSTQSEFARPFDDSGTASRGGGMCTIATYTILVFYLLFYVISHSSGSFPTSTEIKTFPQRDSSEEVFLPKMTCVEPNGCWYMPYNIGAVLESGGRKCYYIEQGVSIPEKHLQIFLDSDPVEDFVALWSDQSNFGFSYDVDVVESANLKTKVKTIPGPTSLGMGGFEGPRYLVYKGKSLFSLVRTLGLDTTVNTWTSTVTAEESTPDTQQNLCCSAPEVTDPNTGTVFTSGSKVLKNGGTSRCDSDLNQLKIKPFPTYSLVTVENPLSVMTIWAILGGALGVIDMFAGFFVQRFLAKAAAEGSKVMEMTSVGVK